jgi:hypothetical protein
MTIRRTRIGIMTAALSTSAAAFYGCSSSSSTTNETPPVVEGGMDSAPVSDSSTDAVAQDAAEAGPADRIGAIFAISDSVAVDGGTKSNSRAGASFFHITTPSGMTTTKTVGPCLVEIIGEGSTTVEEDLSAGVVHITGGAKAVDLTPKSDKTYAVVSSSTEGLWNGGEMLTVTADGKDVPAFTTSLVAPSKVTLSAPAPAAGIITVTRSAGVSATFTGMSSGFVVLYFDIADPSGQQAFSATCTFDASLGSATIPAAAFADFPAGDGTFNFYVKQSSVVMPAGWQVRFTASKAIVDPAGQAMVGQATFK